VLRRCFFHKLTTVTSILSHLFFIKNLWSIQSYKK